MFRIFLRVLALVFAVMTFATWGLFVYNPEQALQGFGFDTLAVIMALTGFMSLCLSGALLCGTLEHLRLGPCALVVVPPLAFSIVLLELSGYYGANNLAQNLVETIVLTLALASAIRCLFYAIWPNTFKFS